MIEIWTNGAGMPSQFVRRAVQAEQAGFDGITMVDSQNLSGDTYIALGIASAETERIRLATGVTNPVTRHPAVTAGAIATVQAVSGGRAHLGIGRGDSALAHLGFSPASPETLERYLEQVQGYLAGEEVPFASEADVDRLQLAGQPTASRIEWIRPGRYPKVPVEVAATGPKVIGVAARQADGILFAVGADPERLRWAIDTAKQARREAGLDPEGQVYGAYVNVVVHDDPEQAYRLGEGGLSLFARFSGMHGAVVGPASDVERETISAIRRQYDMNRHSRAGSPQAAAITAEFAGQFGVFGPPEYCISRLHEITDLGISKLIIVGGSAGADPNEVTAAEERFVEQVMPALRAR